NEARISRRCNLCGHVETRLRLRFGSRLATVEPAYAARSYTTTILLVPELSFESFRPLHPSRPTAPGASASGFHRSAMRPTGVDQSGHAPAAPPRVRGLRRAGVPRACDPP